MNRKIDPNKIYLSRPPYRRSRGGQTPLGLYLGNRKLIDLCQQEFYLSFPHFAKNRRKRGTVIDEIAIALEDEYDMKNLKARGLATRYLSIHLAIMFGDYPYYEISVYPGLHETTITNPPLFLLPDSTHKLMPPVRKMSNKQLARRREFTVIPLDKYDIIEP